MTETEEQHMVYRTRIDLSYGLEYYLKQLQSQNNV
jgi:hypothetical protein